MCEELSVDWNYAYFAAAFLSAVGGAWSGLNVLKLRTGSSGPVNLFFLLYSSMCLGGAAIFCMFFISLRAISVFVSGVRRPLHFDPYVLIASALIPNVLVFSAFWLSANPAKQSPWRMLVGGSGIGSAIVMMQYLGTQSLRIDGVQVKYDSNIVGPTLAIAIPVSCAAVFVFLRLHGAWKSGIKSMALVSTLIACSVVVVNFLCVDQFFLLLTHSLSLSTAVVESKD